MQSDGLEIVAFIWVMANHFEMTQGKKYCIVTGAGSGIGKATALQLVSLGHTVGLTCRTAEQAKSVAKELIEGTGNRDVFGFSADLSEPGEIIRMGREIGEKFPVLDVLINNAGTWYSRRTLNSKGTEMVFAVNHLSYFHLTQLLMNSLLRSQSGRIVNVGSDSHFSGRMHFNDLSLGSRYHGLRSYSQSKLANVLFTYEFARRCPHPHLAVYCLQPGLVSTRIGNKNTNVVHGLAWKLRVKLWGGIGPLDGAKTSLFLALDEAAGNQTGLYWDKCAAKKSSTASYDRDESKKLWEMSERLCGISDYFLTAPGSGIEFNSD